MDEIFRICVHDFPMSQNRPILFQGLRLLIDRLNTNDIAGELWINGSFVTTKVEPDDVDLILRMQSDFVDAANTEQREILDWLNGNNPKSQLHCDSYVHIEYPNDHPQFWLGEYMYSYWMRQWGFGRNGEIKGIAVIPLKRVPR